MRACTRLQLLDAYAASHSSEELGQAKAEFGEPPLQDLEALSFWLVAAMRLSAQDRYHALRLTSLPDRLALLNRHRPVAQPQQRNRWSLSSLLGRWGADEGEQQQPPQQQQQ
jgi:hypothetical protein